MTQQQDPAAKPAMPNPAQQIIVGVSLYMRGDGTVVWQKAPGSPQEPDLNAVHTLCTRAVRDTELRLVIEGVTERQFQIAQQMREAAAEQQKAAEEANKEALRERAAQQQEALLGGQEPANPPAE